MENRRGKCINFGNCAKADRKEIIELSVTEDFECPDCGSTLVEEKVPTKPPVGKYILIGLVLAVLGGAGYFIFKPKDCSKITATLTPDNPTVQVGDPVRLTAKTEPESKTKWIWTSSDESIATVSKTGLVTGAGEGSVTITVTADDNCKTSASVTVTVTPADQPEQKTDPEPDPEPELDKPIDQTQPTKPIEPKDPPKTTGPTRKTVNYSFGKYEGETVNGIPHGQGTMTYTCNVKIAKAGRTPICVDKGDILTGSWYNGDIEFGDLRNSNNEIKGAVNGGRRPNPYNLSNDKCGCD